MKPEARDERRRLDSLLKKLRVLKAHQLEYVEDVVRALGSPLRFSVNPSSDFASTDFAEFFGDILRVHHSFSNEAFTKDKFEHAMMRVLGNVGYKASLAPRGNPGHDMTVGSERWSLKTQADYSIKRDMLHISKFMELGQGRWHDERDLARMRGRMLRHMEAYDRIFSLRCLSRRRRYTPSGQHEYELVEIPKALLSRCKKGSIEMCQKSRQDPKPGYCTVTDDHGEVLFKLYFDGGTERKLQIKDLTKAACVVHVSWVISVA